MTYSPFTLGNYKKGHHLTKWTEVYVNVCAHVFKRYRKKIDICLYHVVHSCLTVRVIYKLLLQEPISKCHYSFSVHR